MQIRGLVVSMFTVVTGLAGSIAAAETWSELATLTFTPVDPNAAPEESRAALVRNLNDEPREPAPEDVIARIRAASDAIETERTANGEYSLGLVPLYQDLAGIYQEVSGFGEAILALEQAQQIVRRREGLHSLDQAAIIDQIIEIETQFSPIDGSIREADLRELVQRNPGDPRNVDILMGMAARQMEIADYLLVNGLPPEFSFNIDIGLGPGTGRSGPPRSARGMASSALRGARVYFSIAMVEAQVSGSESLSMLFELEDSIIDTYYYELMNPALRSGGRYWGGGGQLFGGGIGVLETRLKNLETFSAGAEAVTGVMLEIADWHLMFGSFGTAMDKYGAALNYLRAQDVDEQRVAAIFAPDVPVPLPAYDTSDNIDSDRGNEHGYVDVEIEVNRFGGVRNITVTGRSPNASKPIERRLTKFIYQSRFRPRYVDAEWQPNDRFRMRYEFSYSTS